MYVILRFAQCCVLINSCSHLVSATLVTLLSSPDFTDKSLALHSKLHFPLPGLLPLARFSPAPWYSLPDHCVGLGIRFATIWAWGFSGEHGVSWLHYRGRLDIICLGVEMKNGFRSSACANLDQRRPGPPSPSPSPIAIACKKYGNINPFLPPSFRLSASP